MSLAWFDYLGFAGIGLILLAYALLQAGRWSSRSVGYLLANLTGSLLLLASIIGSPAPVAEVLAPTLMQFAWIAISLFGLWRGFADRAASGKPPAA
ncbi:hypothetical protein [Silanimonas sp.]|uniref:CBU_0592 family membrane protein n=1 Tax=Silanimonas sp. TaxID=1929290 RepID=UPI001BBD6C0C|nr:hypothetical protein [Silanimonas sp.]MBS3895348.1 hypothetical protein [Silanimonas sp.]